MQDFETERETNSKLTTRPNPLDIGSFCASDIASLFTPHLLENSIIRASRPAESSHLSSSLTASLYLVLSMASGKPAICSLPCFVQPSPYSMTNPKWSTSPTRTTAGQTWSTSDEARVESKVLVSGHGRGCSVSSHCTSSTARTSPDRHMSGPVSDLNRRETQADSNHVHFPLPL